MYKTYESKKNTIKKTETKKKKYIYIYIYIYKKLNVQKSLLQLKISAGR